VPSNRKDKNEGAVDKVKGRMKEAGGPLTGNKKAEGAPTRTKTRLSRRSAAKDSLSQLQATNPY
jgi:uncharacterized protein YjbJ (UPF0337 family)